MKQRAVAIVAEYLSRRPLGRLVTVRPVAEDDYVLAIEDIRDGRVHIARTPGDLEPWLKSFKTGECLQPEFGFCGRCDRLHADRDIDGEVFGNCIPCQTELVQTALEVREGTEAD